jgi:hypothetical protein
MTGRTRFLACSLLAGVSLVFASLPVRADGIILSDAFIFYVNGTFNSVSGVAETDEGAPTVNIVTNVHGDHSMVGKATELLEPDRSISDIFGVIDYSNVASVVTSTGCTPDNPLTGATGTCDFLSYSSDPGAVTSAFGGVAFTFFETAANGGLFDATAYLNPGLLANLWTATFFSDVERVPEPGSLLLFGAGLLAFAGAFRRKSQTGH